MTPQYWKLYEIRQTVLQSLKDWARIRERCNHWSMILNHYKTRALVVSRSRTVNHFHGDLVLSGVSIWASPNLDIRGVKFDSKLTFEDLVRGIVYCVSQRISILRFVKHIFVDTSVLLHCHYEFVFSIRCGGLLLNVIFSSSSAMCLLWPGFLVVVVSTSCCCTMYVVHG